ncbi:MAG: acetylglutamate kinase [Anaerolineales bacterium]
MHVLKIGGNELDDPDFLTALALAVAEQPEPVVIVHGGGRSISSLQTRLGLEPRQVDGLRITDQESLSVTEMVLSGQANKRIVRALLGAGLDALGLSGVDRGLLRCRKLEHAKADLGLVGEIVSVRAEVITALVQQGVAPVISPVSLGLDGNTYNVNADHAASAIASAVGASLLDFVSNVPGVTSEGAVLPQLTRAETDELIASGVINGGMVPKVRSALRALEEGVRAVRIVNLEGIIRGGGTWIVT